MGTAENRRTDTNRHAHHYQNNPNLPNLQTHHHHHPQHAPMSHFATPVMRFKAAHGLVSKADESNAADPACLSPRLPSLATFPPGTPPLSPLTNSHWAATTATHSPRAEAFPSPRGSFSEGFPSPRYGVPLSTAESLRQVFPTNNRAGFSPPTPTTSAVAAGAQPQFTLAPLRHSVETPKNGSLPSLVALAASLPENNSSHLSPSREHVGGPFTYERAHSCPSDELRSFHAERYHAPEPAVAPLYILKSSVPRSTLVRSASVDAETAASLRPRSLLAPLGDHQSQPQPHHHPESWQHEHSSEPEAIQRWLEPTRRALNLKSLAESAHQMQLLERSRSPSMSSGPSSPMSMSRCASGGVSEDDEMHFHADSKREKKLCSFPECTSNAVTRGKCISHGGGRRCQRKGCTRGAQSKGLCVAHGGGRICRERGCSNIQRSMGLCIRHGGGKRCSMPGCQKGVVRQDLCTAHGGKRKCRVEDCTKHVKKRGLCRSHANSLFAPSG